MSLSLGACTQARQKPSPTLLHTFNLAFYTDNDERAGLLKCMRILAADGSTLDLPFSSGLAAAYGTHSNHLLHHGDA
ncbi:hypothetical protein PKOR_14265 [Pontibacter korlensis]|uniref:Uncharacterized protein n=1 Tax=Pontibacter korlensis TaxID=400092 RepID=A0A0E3UW11_9BACT|nr:hypothetical protein PKOR_02490 [Pontibacter korlensis]AKD02982.1 hypothetical protein PKOR_07400 [Pontibacter korlensis]AKD04046.1 hypothetical protein PKOR_14265 [Pontibacter korlensis]